jgi:hypothetical protein
MRFIEAASRLTIACGLAWLSGLATARGVAATPIDAGLLIFGVVFGLLALTALAVGRR